MPICVVKCKYFYLRCSISSWCGGGTFVSHFSREARNLHNNSERILESIQALF